VIAIYLVSLLPLAAAALFLRHSDLPPAPAAGTLRLGGSMAVVLLLSGLVNKLADQRIAEIQGFDLWHEEIAARRSLAYVSEQPDLTPYATIRDVIYLVCRLRSAQFEREQEVLEEEPGSVRATTSVALE